FKAWEELNAHRMHEVRAYVDDAERFLDDAPDFDWHAILLNAHRPKLTVVTSASTALSEEELLAQFYNRIPLFNRIQSQLEGVKQQLKFIKVQSRSHEKELSRALVFDFSQGQLVEQTSWDTSGKKLLSQKRFYQFNNAWLYELR